MSYSVLVIDDEADIRNLVSDVLEDEKYETRVAAGDLEALSKLDEKVPTVVILDIWLQGSELDGLGILEIIKKKYPYLPVIIISGHGNIETAVNALKMGIWRKWQAAGDSKSLSEKSECRFDFGYSH